MAKLTKKTISHTATLTFWSAIKKITGVANNINDDCSIEAMTVWQSVSQRAHYQDPETEAAKWNSAIIIFIIYICALKM